jgi:hypothetical protein
VIVRKGLAVSELALAGTAVLGFPAGVAWAAIAPRAQLVEVSQGTAQVVNAETSAFIAADGWFCLISVVVGLLTGLLGYWLAVRGAGGPTATAALIAGAIAGTLIMLWTGEQIGQATYQHQLATSATNTIFNSSLALGAKSCLALWPLVTAAIIFLIEFGRRHDAPRQEDTLDDSAAVF